MDGDQLLALLAASAAGDGNQQGMLPRAVRFALEYDTRPDVTAERGRVSAVLSGAPFTLAPLDDAPDTAGSRFLVLQIAGARRTMSRRALFEMADALRRKLSLRSCEPDTGAVVYFAPGAPVPGILDPESAVVDLWCWSKAQVPTDTRWALNAIRTTGAWAKSKGAGIVIGQPDTGIASHVELDAEALALAKSTNILDGGSAPTDPLLTSMSNPGHGTATASVAVSREAGRMVGSAPGATLVPIRCINDVKIFDGIPVAKAVVHARQVGCDVITMSLGGIYSQSLDAAISDAVAAGLIVLAAAGNCVGFVVYPASSHNVIAVAGVDNQDKPWIGSSSGPAVGISAPAENVYIARRKPNDTATDLVEGGQGTSFAVALTAGVAALWLSHHGRVAVQGEAKKRHTSVQALFRSALQQTARRPGPGWDTANLGPGIVQADQLLSLALTDIALQELAPAVSEGTLEMVARLAQARKTVDGFDWVRHGAEASLLASEAAIISRRAQAGSETVGTGQLRPTTELARTAPAFLRPILGTDAGQKIANVLAHPRSDKNRLLRLVGKTSGGGLESVENVTAEQAQKRLQGTHKRDLLKKLDSAFKKMPTADPALLQERARVMSATESALDKLAVDGASAKLGTSEIVGLESLVSLHDRPALRIKNGMVDPDDPLLGEWSGALLPAADKLRPALASVGRIDLDDTHVGSGFVVAPNRILTNRHVLEAIAEEFQKADGTSQWVFTGDVTINFTDEARDVTKRFKITGLIATGRDRIDEIVNFSHLDLAVLHVESDNAAGLKLPPALPFQTAPELVAKKSEILLAGYPARPGSNALRDPESGQIRDDVAKRLGQIFGLAYSVKYLSPGEISASPGTLQGDSRKWVFAHDATTLGGNSGSWIFNLGEPFGIIGLHFGGGTLRANYAHGLLAVRSSGVLAAAGLDGTTWV